MLPFRTTNLLLRSPSVTSLRQVRTASRTHSSKSLSHGGVIFCFLSSTLFFSLDVQPSRSGHQTRWWPTSIDSYRPFSLASCAFKVFEHLISARIAPHILPQLDSSQGGFRWGADAMAFSLVDTLRLRSHEHTLDSGIAQGRILSPVLFNLLVDSLAVTFRSVIPDPCRHVCHLYADDLQVALDAVHAWGVRWRFSFGIALPSPPLCLWSSARPPQLLHTSRRRSLALSPILSWRPHVDFLCSRGDRLFHQARAWCLVEGLLLVFCFRHLCSLELFL